MKTLPLCALVALPALIQPALASDNLETFETLVQEGLQTAQSYAEIIELVADKKTTPAEGAQRIIELTANLKNIQSSLMALLEKLSADEKTAVQEALEDPEMVAAGKAIEDALKELHEALVEEKFYKSPELQKACEAYMSTYSQ